MASVKEEIARLMWKPTPDRSTNIYDFQSVVNEAFGLDLSELILYFYLIYFLFATSSCYRYGGTYSMKCDFFQQQSSPEGEVC